MQPFAGHADRIGGRVQSLAEHAKTLHRSARGLPRRSTLSIPRD